MFLTVYVKKIVIVCGFFLVFSSSSLQAYWLFNPCNLLSKGYFLLLSVLAVQGGFNKIPCISKENRVTIAEQKNNYPYHTASSQNEYMVLFQTYKAWKKPNKDEEVLVCMGQAFADFHEKFSKTRDKPLTVKASDLRPYPHPLDDSIDESDIHANGRCYRMNAGAAIKMLDDCSISVQKMMNRKEGESSAICVMFDKECYVDDKRTYEYDSDL
ncbi:hypothetical protein CI610_01035 [invertebrate metagenome]|uniref:Uncharacterized protein n=1 Tax=invertebrate metagenome TaxID=1711999 RepID=A0A2H9T9U3_9ZZZZ